ncbi:uncharacterized protein LOC123529905 [Mercenaria mercenaria]|uniref:uncharacterized protein LOC123529905 n=1 Tax=Mercenaria mercenaria TaxID=6596 RepID=UPI001E1DF884|nr:uncharacterized protein LOC123529905 [Mercenaria mercenaria]
MRIVVRRAPTLVRSLLAFQFFLTSSGSSTCNDTVAIPWHPSWFQSRDDLYCKNICLGRGDYEQCCVCNSCTSWEGEEIDLFIEELSVTGPNVVLPHHSVNDSNVYQIYRGYSEMKELPINICNNITDTKLEKLYSAFADISYFRERIVRINLEFNEIKILDDISCLRRLDELNLQYNRLTFLSNTSLTNLTFLRTIQLKGNKLIGIEPNTLSSPDLYIFNADISKNELETQDVTNMYTAYTFCEINFASNAIKEFVNEGNFILNTSKKYGPGFLNLQNNAIEKFPDLKTLLNLNDLNEMGKAWKFGFDFQGVPVICDCSLEPFMSLAEDIIESIWIGYFEVKCAAPENLKNQLIPKIDPSMFVCEYNAESDCQTPQCTCVDEPNKNTLFIDCSNANLTKFPTIPLSAYSTRISLNLSSNSIKNIPNKPFLSKISHLDLSNNDILEISEDTARKLENATLIDLTNNTRLLKLPQMFQYRNACSTVLGNIVVDCDCESLWISEWIKSKGCTTSQFYCNIPEQGIVPAGAFHENDLDCVQESFLYIWISIVLGSILLIFLVFGWLLRQFRYELLIVYLRMRRTFRKDNLVYPNFKFDVYISLDENNDQVRDWVNRHLEKYLTYSGYNVFLPYRDIPYGSVRDTEIINVLKDTRTLLVVLSNTYFGTIDDERLFTECEWKYGWTNFRKERQRNIVLINFDHISSREIKHAQIKAFLRVGCCIDFGNHDRNIMENIRSKLDTRRRKRRAGQNYYRTFSQSRECTKSALSYNDIEMNSS